MMIFSKIPITHMDVFQAPARLKEGIEDKEGIAVLFLEENQSKGFLNFLPG